MHITEYFEDIETSLGHKGHTYSVGEALTIAILGSFCGLQNVGQIHHWAMHENTRALLAGRFGIRHVPCYPWLLRLLAIIEPESLNRCFMRWAQSLMPESGEGLTLACDGKAIRPAGRMEGRESPCTSPAPTSRSSG